jgi:hypothetical protein
MYILWWLCIICITCGETLITYWIWILIWISNWGQGAHDSICSIVFWICLYVVHCMFIYCWLFSVAIDPDYGGNWILSKSLRKAFLKCSFNLQFKKKWFSSSRVSHLLHVRKCRGIFLYRSVFSSVTLTILII